VGQPSVRHDAPCQEELEGKGPEHLRLRSGRAGSGGQAMAGRRWPRQQGGAWRTGPSLWKHKTARGRICTLPFYLVCKARIPRAEPFAAAALRLTQLPTWVRACAIAAACRRVPKEDDALYG
jgi:hypothetical protein